MRLKGKEYVGMDLFINQSKAKKNEHVGEIFYLFPLVFLVILNPLLVYKKRNARGLDLIVL